MFEEIRTFWQGQINEELLLGARGVRLPNEHWELVVSAVAQFVHGTKRLI